MNIITTARHFSLDADDRQFAHERLARVGRFLRERERNGVEAHLTITAEKNQNRHVAEILLRVRRHELVSREEGADPRDAVELAVDGLERQMRRIADRTAERRKGDRQRTADAVPAAAPAPADDDEYDWLVDGTVED
jgi:ribosomal subunit interface protein